MRIEHVVIAGLAAVCCVPAATNGEAEKVSNVMAVPFEMAKITGIGSVSSVAEKSLLVLSKHAGCGADDVRRLR